MIDGYNLSEEAERKLNEAFAVVFRGEAADEVLAYLRNITINSIEGPQVDPNQLMHKEGARWLMAIINTRIKEGVDNGRTSRGAGSGSTGRKQPAAGRKPRSRAARSRKA